MWVFFLNSLIYFHWINKCKKCWIFSQNSFDIWIDKKTLEKYFCLDHVFALKISTHKYQRKANTVFFTIYPFTCSVQPSDLCLPNLISLNYFQHSTHTSLNLKWKAPIDLEGSCNYLLGNLISRVTKRWLPKLLD